MAKTKRIRIPKRYDPGKTAPVEHPIYLNKAEQRLLDLIQPGKPHKGPGGLLSFEIGPDSSNPGPTGSQQAGAGSGGNYSGGNIGNQGAGGNVSQGTSPGSSGGSYSGGNVGNQGAGGNVGNNTSPGGAGGSNSGQGGLGGNMGTRGGVQANGGQNTGGGNMGTRGGVQANAGQNTGGTTNRQSMSSTAVEHDIATTAQAVHDAMTGNMGTRGGVAALANAPRTAPSLASTKDQSRIEPSFDPTHPVGMPGAYDPLSSVMTPQTLAKNKFVGGLVTTEGTGFINGVPVNPFNTVYGGTKYPQPPDQLTNMTLSEIADYQRKVLNPATGKINTSAVGAVQMQPATMLEAARRLGYDPMTTLATPEVQKNLAMEIANMQGVKHSTWASLNKSNIGPIRDAYNQASTGFDPSLSPGSVQSPPGLPDTGHVPTYGSLGTVSLGPRTGKLADSGQIMNDAMTPDMAQPVPQPMPTQQQSPYTQQMMKAYFDYGYRPPQTPAGPKQITDRIAPELGIDPLANDYRIPSASSIPAIPDRAPIDLSTFAAINDALHRGRTAGRILEALNPSYPTPTTPSDRLQTAQNSPPIQNSYQMGDTTPPGLPNPNTGWPTDIRPDIFGGVVLDPTIIAAIEARRRTNQYGGGSQGNNQGQIYWPTWV